MLYLPKTVKASIGPKKFLNEFKLRDSVGGQLDSAWNEGHKQPCTDHEKSASEDRILILVLLVGYRRSLNRLRISKEASKVLCWLIHIEIERSGREGEFALYKGDGSERQWRFSAKIEVF